MRFGVLLASSHDPDDGFGESAGPSGIVAGRSSDVLPRIGIPELADALRRLPPDELALSLRSKLVPLVCLPGLRLFVACGEPALAMARHDGLRVVGYAEAADFVTAACRVHGPGLLREATLGLALRQPALSARWQISALQVLMFFLLACGAVGLALFLPLHLGWAIVSTASGVFFLAVIALRVLCLLPRRRNGPPRLHPLSDRDLPRYSVLVPLFRETAVLGQLLSALTAIDYPTDRLDIKLILEEGDVLMRRAVAGLRLPPHFDVIVVPSGLPQTKPRALNFALPFCRGQLLTIYDAEDIPDPRQLRQAAAVFAAAPHQLACLQAELHFYNPQENWLTRQFTIEYATLFGMILPTLADHRLPLLLGGTSNHFRIDILRAVGGWDPFNVTEDADLGLRLARLGYDTGTLESHTFEEANVNLLNWMKQRARWLKGFLVTWLVHMRHPVALWRELGPAGFWIAQTATLGVFASALLHPFCLAGTLVAVIASPPLATGAGLLTTGLAGLSLLVLVAGYVTAMMAGLRALRLLGLHGWHLTVLTMPAYWLLLSAAAWFALWQFLAAPYHWNKTEHGLSGRHQHRQRRPTGIGATPRHSRTS